ncbi:MAG: class I SAM-dependent methyltransferase [Desulfovibrio sp.]|jgi:hypothetical protein|nr:class I SAM-dependent methyltransferase [Desulfovibrio sp.]
MGAIYNDEFYKNRYQDTVDSARKILSSVFSIIPLPESCLDLGCGVGAWLSVAQELGVKSIYGYDGEWVKEEYLRIPHASFTKTDLNVAFPVSFPVDFAICLEVAEHIPHSSADILVKFLTDSARFILFSAATPYQTGDGHINEQWPTYWEDKFADHGFTMLDLIRKDIWEDVEIPFWYRQNIFFCVHNDSLDSLNVSPVCYKYCKPISSVHPELLERYTNKENCGENVDITPSKIGIKQIMNGVLFRILLLPLLFFNRKYIVEFVNSPCGCLRKLHNRVIR